MKIRIKTYNGELPSYLTVGKVYDGAINYSSPYVLILDDYGDELDVRLDSSNHLNGGSWEVVSEK